VIRLGDDTFIVTADDVREAMAFGWDKAVESMRFEDGSPLEVIQATNPYRGESKKDQSNA